MTLTKSKWAAVLVLVLGLAGGVGMATHSSPAEPPQNLSVDGKVPEKQAPDDRKMDPLASNWVMALPAGFRYEVNVCRLAPDRYVLEKAVCFSGEYERRRDRLVMVKPADRGKGGFEWVIAEDCLILVKQRPVEKLGSDYRGATLKRPGSAGSHSRQPAATAENRNPARIEGDKLSKLRDKPQGKIVGSLFGFHTLRDPFGYWFALEKSKDLWTGKLSKTISWEQVERVHILFEYMHLRGKDELESIIRDHLERAVLLKGAAKLPKSVKDVPRALILQQTEQPMIQALLDLKDGSEALVSIGEISGGLWLVIEYNDRSGLAVLKRTQKKTR